VQSSGAEGTQKIGSPAVLVPFATKPGPVQAQ
jgi:hypothetical protein